VNVSVEPMPLPLYCPAPRFWVRGSNTRNALRIRQTAEDRQFGIAAVTEVCRRLAARLQIIGRFARRGRFLHLRRALIVVVALYAGPLGAQPIPIASRQGNQTFHAKVDEAARAFANEPAFKRIAPEKRLALVEFVVGNVLFVATHEMGHALIAEMGLPVLGREEDAADEFAVLTALQHGEKDFSDRVLIDSAEGWFMDARRDKKIGDKPTYYDQHGVNEQRGYQIVCLVFGSNPVRFKELADETKLPDDRRRTCAWDYDTASRSWEAVLAPHRRVADQPEAQIQVKYEDAKGELEVYAQTFRAIRFLEAITDLAAGRFAWRYPITMEMRTCGEVDARWTNATRTLYICYEMAQDFANLYRDYAQRR
jgi:hypothetical protein